MVLVFGRLRARYKNGSLNELLSRYNECLKLFFGYKRRDSVTKIVLDLGLPSSTAVIHISSYFLSSWCNCSNAVVTHFNSIMSVQV